MKKRDSKGKFIYTGGSSAEKKDNHCLDCGKNILRESKYCRRHSQIGKRSHKYIHGNYKCLGCGKIKKHPNIHCNNCAHKIQVGVNHPLFKVEGFTYSSLHDWVRRWKGNPKYCSNNIQHKGRFVWANISGEYKRDLSDWHSLCNSCNLTDNVKIPERFYKEVGINV